MAVTLEELVVKIQADVAEFNSRLKSVEDTTSKATKKMEEGFKGLKNPIAMVSDAMGGLKGVLTAVGVTAAAHVIHGALETAETLHNLSENTGVSTDMLQGLGFAAIQCGASEELMNDSLLVLTKNVGLAAAGTEEGAKKFEMLGLKIRDASGNLKSTQTIVFELADKVQKAGSEAEQAAILTEVFGRQGTRLVGVFKDGAAGLQNFQAEANRLGVVIQADLIKGAADANDKLQAFGKIISAQVTSALVTLAPEINSVVSGLIELTVSTAKAIRGMQALYNEMKLASGGTVDSAAKTRMYQAEIENLQERIKRGEESVKKWGDTMGNQGPAIDALKAKLVEKKAALAALTAEQGKSEKATKAATDALAKQTAAYEAQKKLQDKGKEVFDSVEDKDPGKKYEKELKALDAYHKKVGKEDEKFLKARQQLVQNRVDAEAAIENKQVDQLLERNKMMMDLDRDKYATEIADNEQKVQGIIDQEVKGSDAEATNSLKLAEYKKSIRDKDKQGQMDTLNFISTLQKSKSAELAAVGKAAAIANATVHTFEAANLALSSFPPPLSFIMMAATVAAGVANVASIAGVELAGGIDSVPGVGNRDNFPAMLMPGERVVPKNTNQDLKEFLSTRGQTDALLGSILRELRAPKGDIVVKISNREVFRANQRAQDAGRRVA